MNRQFTKWGRRLFLSTLVFLALLKWVFSVHGLWMLTVGAFGLVGGWILIAAGNMRPPE